MTKFKLRKYFAVLSITFILFVSFCAYTYWFLFTNPSIKFSEEVLFLNLTGDKGNFTSYSMVVVFFLILFILFLFYLFPKENPIILVRFSSRCKFITHKTIDSALFAVLFSFLLEIVSITTAIICFDMSIILKFKFLQYSIIEWLTVFLFYFRSGLVLISFEIITSKKIAPILTVAVYVIEYLTADSFMVSKIWFPFRDSLVVSRLMMNEMTINDIWSILLRAFGMSVLVGSISYFLFRNKDILCNVKK